MKTSDRIRRARIGAGLTQSALADRSGVPQPMISAYENGTRSPTPETLAVLLGATGLRPGEVLRENRGRVVETAEQFGASRVRIFGSAVAGVDVAMSDIDLLVHFEPGVMPSDLEDLESKLEEILGIPVDVVSDRGLRRRHRDIVETAVPI